jgi:hypothetical protein
MSTTYNEDVNIRATLACSRFTAPAGFLMNAHVATGAAISAAKLEHQYSISRQIFAPGTAVVAATELLHIVRGNAASIIDIEAAVSTIATGPDRIVQVDLQRSTAGAAFQSVLSVPVEFTNGSFARIAIAGTISSPTLADGDVLQIAISVSGSAGNQAAGLLVNVCIREDAD